ncbi:hypothetical protein BWI15_10605 [Kribbella sp. ALI-6-A]|uniref:hypothetical protein n=1 Tax=Kribbella sp. ALI-6-A TaxID=1933817 RepID=UPI00097C1E12|nr:hypothetical protein [Kribbella sp. ALI-6-A]ONI73862.1 hypothetical protein BWI15_10605 [Kribbella sp. ALI-6-A]
MATERKDITLVPILSRGPHRDPRRGACFMEYASHLAGLEWSDRPSCTHPLLALVAREVNDELSDAARVQLVPMIPTVIGLVPTDPRYVPALVVRCVTPVLPVVSPQFRRTLMGALSRAQDLLAELAASPVPRCEPTGYLAEAPLVLAGAIRAVTDFRAPDGDALLRRLLSEAIDESRSWMPEPAEPRATPLVMTPATTR